MDKETFYQTIINPLIQQENIDALAQFDQFHKLEQINLYEKIEWSHEFLENLLFKLKESKSSLDKEVLADYLFSFFKKTIDEYDYNPIFVSQQCKGLIIYYKNQKNTKKVIEVLEFLVQKGIIDEEKENFHVQLDQAYRAYFLEKKKNSL